MTDLPNSGSPEIFSRGYRAYEGPRTGVRSGMVAVAVASIQRAFGLRRKFRFKVVPLITIFIAYVPGVVFLGVAVLLPSELASEVVADYAVYYGFISISMILLSAFVVPEVLGSDRKTGMFGITMASPLNRWQYLLSKFAAIMAVMATVTLLPLLFLLIGYSLVDLGPDGFGELIEILFNIVVSGVIFAAFFALFGMAVSTLTDRPLFATAGVVMGIIASEALSNIVADSTDAPEAIRLFGLTRIPNELTVRLWGFAEDLDPLESVSNLGSFGAWLAAVVLFAVVVAVGYARLEVTK